MPVVTAPLALIIFAAGAIAGSLGALLGLGGGVFLVPFLNLVLGFPFSAAAAISLTTVIATSSTVSAGRAGKQLINMKLGMLLEVATAAGSFLGGGTAPAAAAATSAFMIGVTATAGATIYYGHGQLVPALAAAACLGVQLGSWGGMRFGAAASAKWLKILMAIVLAIVSAMMFLRGGR